MRYGKTIFQKAILPCFGAFNAASFFFVHETERETIDFGTPSDLTVEIFYCCYNGTVSFS